MSVCHFDTRTSVFTQILAKYSQEEVEIASLTKIMTCFLVIQICEFFQLDPKEERVAVSDKACKMPGTSAKLLYSDHLSVFDTLHGLMLPSGNDAAVALAEWGGKTIRKYITLFEKSQEEKQSRARSQLVQSKKKRSYTKLFIYHMNRLCDKLGLNHTRFCNPHGLMNNKAFSCSADISKLSCIAMQNDLFQ